MNIPAVVESWQREARIADRPRRIMRCKPTLLPLTTAAYRNLCQWLGSNNEAYLVRPNPPGGFELMWVREGG